MSKLRLLGGAARNLWRWLRAASGDDAYERYVAHTSQAHPARPVLSARAFYDERQRRKWSGINRCC
ncbi:MAG TPA: YbdD/YjiX family protein [Steroidobacteraceae bacterium]|nr:YbdD/YjiX family protein [Steroidobacteraceae bacterium]